jgi:hypothetical protein
MAKDKIPTKVKFLVNETDEREFTRDVFAYFPNDKYNNTNMRLCYQHIGQHGAIHPDYADESREATPDEYKDLKKELEDIGYLFE